MRNFDLETANGKLQLEEIKKPERGNNQSEFKNKRNESMN